MDILRKNKSAKLLLVLKEILGRLFPVYVYVTIMYRYGDKQGHSYCIGTFFTLKSAKTAGITEQVWRGKKYDPVVEKHEIGRYIWDAEYAPEVVFEDLHSLAKSIR